ncbi:MAG TPA: ABC transporter permease [Thermotogota bacterium]|nr:ABC transporter permease [Thermotogota bacterium]HPM21105.1 ABC transporter permease [Thermotogota bacterium]
MRMKGLLWGDIVFQYKYGFYFLYSILTVFYIGVAITLPQSWREKIVILMIFTDPAAMGLFFMGAIVLFEKSQKVLDSLAVSPVKPIEYVVSKLLSLAFISTSAGLAIAMASGLPVNLFTLTISLFCSSCLFSSFGLIIAAKATTLNRFILATIPIEITVMFPAVGYLFGWRPIWGLVHPGVCMMEVCLQGSFVPVAFGILFGWTVLFLFFALAVIRAMLQSVGGVAL